MNPASTRVKERAPGTGDFTGVTQLVFPAHTVTPIRPGVVFVDVAPSASAGGGSLAFVPSQNASNPRLLTIPGTDSWVKSSIRMYLQGQRLKTALLVIGGAGNRTITLDATVPVSLGDDLEGEGVKA